MKISIIIPNYNGAKYLSVCLDSLSRQSFKPFEIIIVDNGSIDNSCQLISRNYSHIKLIRFSKNHGFSKAVNEGIKVAKGKYVVLLNNDTEAQEDWLYNLANCINGDKKIFSCCSKMIQYYNKEKIDDAGDEYTILGWAYKRGDGLDIHKYKYNEEVFSSCAGAAIYRKSIFDKIGYFDEDFFAYMEDVDISYRAKIYGYKNIYCSKAKIFHIGSATSGSKYNSFKVKLAAKNNVYVIIKNMQLLQLFINSPFLILGFLIKIIFFYKKGFGKEYLIGLKEGLKTIKNINKVKFEKKNLLNYIKIEIDMIRNTFKYVFGKSISKICKR